ncbi:MAG TPA: pitrilysin family protein [Pyrinomonadaceae bacterium]|nr:pitrilysin family protein [Pyrinomonadaceae bacterium]
MSRSILRAITHTILPLLLLANTIKGQSLETPERFQLLNGLKVVLLSKPNDPDVILKLRIHSGAAFDLAGKAGTVALLGDLLFPDPSTHEYFSDELNGRLNVVTDYDSLTITLQGRAQGFERIVEMLRTAVVTPQLTQENIDKARDGRLKIIKETGISPAIVADRTIATRLFGDFPYGRPYGGTAESLERITRPDLMITRERFLNPNNATLVIIGGVQKARATRALRQLLGVWRKSEAVAPSSFQQPAPADARILIFNAPSDQSAEVRVAVRGLAHGDPDFLSASLIASIARRRWETALPDLSRTQTFVRHDGFTLPGIFAMGASVDNLLAAKALTTAQQTIKSLTEALFTDTELERARNEVRDALVKQLSTNDGLANSWLDSDTYSIPSGSDQLAALRAISPTDLRRTANRLFWNVPIAIAVVGNSEALKAQLDHVGKLEVIGEVTTPVKLQPQPSSTPKPE